ncbi:MAG: hypothetical protein BWY54_00624 [Candidatus Dependentiae bacterium ADurb.Bin331]|nr:MAG: hypothetical protein BWY54_00624 [Candidatus Dependentiae bacterium ADurb.Bin331]
MVEKFAIASRSMVIVPFLSTKIPPDPVVPLVSGRPKNPP